MSTLLLPLTVRNDRWEVPDPPYNNLYGEAPPERGVFFRLQVYERVEISLVEVLI